MKSAKGILNRLGMATVGAEPGGRPPAAVEFADEGVLASTLTGGAPAYAFAALRAGELEPSLTETSLARPQAVSEALKKALEPLTLRKRALTVVLPDSLVRVFLLDFDEFPAKAGDALPVLRFRLRKMVPFEVEQSQVSYQVLSQTRSETRVLAAITPHAVVAEFEGLMRGAGFEPGAMLPATLAALAAAPGDGPALVANLSAQALTTAIVKGDDLLLYRALDLPTEESERRAEVERGLAVTAAYYEDKLGTRPERIYYAGRSRGADSPAEEFGRWLNDPEWTIADLMERPETGALTTMGGMNPAAVVGALKGAA